MENLSISQPSKVIRRFTNVSRLTNLVPENNNITKAMIGDFTDCPSINTKSIRIFISSTFSDMAAERNVIMDLIYPKLKSYCQEKYGIEIQMLDMRWGVPADSEVDHKGPELCYQEIKNCQQSSCGVNFIAIIGQRYGKTSPPFMIPDDEFLLIIEDLEFKGENTEVLKQWYIIDENNVPPVYFLQPIPVKSNNKQPTLDEIKEARSAWSSIEELISRQLSESIRTLNEKGLLKDHQVKKYLCSVTEQEVDLGICSVQKLVNEKNTAAFIRSITDVTKHLNHPKIRRFIDLKTEENDSKEIKKEIKYEIDKNLNEIMNNLVNNSIKSNVKLENICELQVKWKELLRTMDNKYLKEFERNFLKTLTRLIDENMKSNMAYQDEDLYNEVVHHNIACVKYVKQFQGRAELIGQVENYLFGYSRKPLVIFGASGSGKTSIIAKSAHVCREIMKERLGESKAKTAVILLRFLGTSPGTSSIRNTFMYLRKQLLTLLMLEESESGGSGITENFKELINNVYELMGKLADKFPVFVFIDSVDQLNRSNGAYTLGWLRLPLPPGVKMVLSTLPNYENILVNLQNIIDDSSCFIEVLPLNPALCMGILESLLKENHRTLTAEQSNILIKAFEHCSLPIYMQLLFSTVIKWRSYYTVNNEFCTELTLKYTVREAIFKFFGDLKKKHNPIFVQHALAFITASRNGLSVTELEDIMSLDDELLRSIFTHHLPSKIRVPPFLWSRLRRDIGNYLTEREADNTQVLYWYHRQFIEVARDYFLLDSEFSCYIHDIMADYFLGIYANGRTKRFYYPSYVAKKLRLSSYSDEDRGVLSQPFKYVSKYDDDESGTNDQTNHVVNNDNKHQRVIYNQRKISELPWHLVKSRRFAEFADVIAFNYEFLISKLTISSRANLLEDLVLAKNFDVSYRESINELYNAIRMSIVSLSSNVLNLPFDLMARLSKFNNYRFPRIQDLLKQVQTKIPSDIGYLPIGQCLDSGSEMLYLGFDTEFCMGVLLPNQTIILCSLLSPTITYYDLEGSFIKSIEVECNLFMSLKFIFGRPLKEDQEWLNIVMPVITNTEDESDNNDKRKAIYRLNVYTGKLIEISKLMDHFSKLSDTDFFIVTENYIQIDSRLGLAELLHISDQKSIYKYSKGVIHTHISHNELFGVVMVKLDDKTYIKLVDLITQQEIDISINPSFKGIFCSILDPDILLVCLHKSNRFFVNHYRIVDNSLVKLDDDFIFDCSKTPRRCREKYFPEHNTFVVTFQMQGTFTADRHIYGFIYNLNSNKYQLLIKTDAAISKKLFDAFGESVMVEIDNTGKLLFTTATEVLYLIWSIETGEILEIITKSQSEGLFSGITRETNHLIICHFGNDSKGEDFVTILCKIYDINKYLLSIDTTKVDEFKFENQIIQYNHDVEIDYAKYSYKFLTDDKNEFDGMFLCQASKSSNKNCLIDIFENISMDINTASVDYLNIAILTERNSNDVTIIKIYHPSKLRGKVYCLNSLGSLANIKLPHYVDHKLSFICNNPYYFTKALKNILLDDIIKNWFLYILYGGETQKIYSLKLDNNKYTEIKSTNSSLEKFNVCQKRPNNSDQMIFIKYENQDLVKAFTPPKSEVNWIGYISIIQFKHDQVNDEITMTQLFNVKLDIGDFVSILDEYSLVNYKLQKYNYTTGELMDQLIDLPDDRYLIYPMVLGNNNRYLIGCKIKSPYKVIFHIGWDEEAEEMDLMEPPNTIEMYDLKNKQLVGDYTFESYIDYIFLLRNRNYFFQMTECQMISVMKLNMEDSGLEYAISKNNNENKLNKYENLRKTLSKALERVIDVRPLDPIAYIGLYLKDSSL